MEKVEIDLHSNLEEPEEPNKQDESKSKVVKLRNLYKPVRDYFLWSLFNTIYMNACCLGFLGLIFAMKTRDQNHLNNVRGAKKFAKAAKGLNISATILSMLFIMCCVAYYVYITVLHI